MRIHRASQSFFNVLTIIILLQFSLNGNAQDSKQEKEAAKIEEVKKLVDQKFFDFRAQSASPQKGGLIQITASNNLLSVGDTVVCNLPYYGRVYQPSFNAPGGINFKSAKFDYEKKDRKKGGYNISITTKDGNYFRLFLTVFKEGNASLQVSSNDRQSISYNGYIEKKK